MQDLPQAVTDILPPHGSGEDHIARCPPGCAQDVRLRADPKTYDYAGAVLFNAHASALWARFTIYLRREIAARQFLTSGRSNRLHALYELALRTGLRKGELLSLHWEDVDLSAGTASIRRTLQRTQTGGLTTLPTKTRASERRIALPNECIHSLKEHREAQEAEREAAAEGWKDNGLVFTTPTGGPIDPAKLNRSYRALLDRAGLRRIRFHDLRHSTATLLLEQGVELIVIKELLGHAHIGVTATVYAHVRLRLQCDAIDLLGHTLHYPTATANQPDDGDDPVPCARPVR